MTRIALLDGSVGQELVGRSNAAATPLWSTQVMIDQLDLVRQVHADYFAVGASVATTNTYAVLADRLQRVNLAGHIDTLINTAVTQAVAARDAHGSGRIAGSIGPLGASYRPDMTASQDKARELYGGNVALMDADVDFFLIETMSSLHQAETALRAVGHFATKPVWLAVTVDDLDGSKLRSGEPLSEISTLIMRLEAEYQPNAVLINCSRPEAVTAGIGLLRDTGLPFGGYANGFTGIPAAFLKDNPTVDALDHREDLGPEAYAEFALGWVEQGATIVGGCCEVGPDHIALLARRLLSAGHEIV